MMQTTAASAERVFEFLEEEEEIEVEKDAVPVDTLAGNVTFEHVNFGYNKDQTIINDFSVDVKEGQKVSDRRTNWSWKDNVDQTSDAFL